MIGGLETNLDAVRVHALDFGRQGAVLVERGCVVCRAA